MNKIFSVLLASSLLTGVGCVPDNQSIHILNAMQQPNKDCIITIDETVQKSGGSVDVGLTNTYIGALLITSDLETTNTQGGGTVIQSKTRNDFHISEVNLAYDTGGKIALKPRTLPIAGLVKAGGTLGLGLEFLTPDNAVLLADSGQIPLEGQGLLITVKIKLTGKFVNGSKLTTPEFFFPLTIYSSLVPKCTATQELVATSDTVACRNVGQDGSGYRCVDKAAPK